MRFAISALAFAASVVFVGAQDLQGIPSCALACFATAVPATGCSLTDTQCQCTTGRDSITASITLCVPDRCSAEDIASIAPAVEAICGRAGITISNLPTAVSTISSTNTASRTATTTGAASTTTSPRQQTENAAVLNLAGMGAVAMGFAAAFL
ncbi:hypothetical protein K458DRAFT_295982 [Lentithecium fluviatile CBS 122367]|uniref:CFEM domain-containing protein n=1 Tax=Lentithecium fluviatile CBS 122367 TaxID=1168545 RepID=A0A6G1J9I4_9PLEO|nr:hypothetical protein K458DRAFT_295982 [Lentithecium fluviatile CBS 122367]